MATININAVVNKTQQIWDHPKMQAARGITMVCLPIITAHPTGAHVMFSALGGQSAYSEARALRDSQGVAQVAFAVFKTALAISAFVATVLQRPEGKALVHASKLTGSLCGLHRAAQQRQWRASGRQAAGALKEALGLAGTTYAKGETPQALRHATTAAKLCKSGFDVDNSLRKGSKMGYFEALGTTADVVWSCSKAYGSSAEISAEIPSAGKPAAWNISSWESAFQAQISAIQEALAAR